MEEPLAREIGLYLGNSFQPVCIYVGWTDGGAGSGLCEDLWYSRHKITGLA